MSFPTRWRREEDLWFVCLFRGAAKGPLLWWFFGAPLWMPPRPPPPAYSCRGAPCAWNLNEEPGAAGGALPGGEVTAALGPCAAGTALCVATTSQASPAQLSSSVPAMALMRGATVPVGWLGCDKSSLSSPAGSAMVVGCMAVTDVTANRFRSAASSSLVSAFLNLLLLLKLRDSCSPGHLLHYHFLGRGEVGTGGGAEGDGWAVWSLSDKGSCGRTTPDHLAPHICKLTSKNST